MRRESFDLFNFRPLAGPVIVSVPHAGRDYDAALIANLRVPAAAVRPLEDRHADRLVDIAIAAGTPAIVARTPRLAIDLNRAPDDLDARSHGRAHTKPVSAKARAGLGLIPTRLSDIGPLWRLPRNDVEIETRLRDVHAPYHATIARALGEARLRWGAALMIDVHSMPSLREENAAEIVIGDRFGESASARVSETAEAVLNGLGFRVALNAPYAGGYIVSRHGRPASGVHALQIEIDRALYLDVAHDAPGPGLARMQNAVLHLVEALRAELTPGVATAAE